MSQTIELHLKAFDEASSTIASVNSNLTGSLSKIDDSTKQVTASTTNMGKAYESASGQINEINAQYGRVVDSAEKVDVSTKKASVSLTQQVSAVNSLASSGVILALSFDKVEKAQLASEKANLNVQRSAENLDQAQKSLTETTMKYGAGSVQAQDAQDKLRIAEEAHNVSIERQKIVCDDLNQTYMQTAVSIIPAVIGVVTSLSAVKGIIAGATQAEAVAEGVGAVAKTAALGPTGALTGATWALNSALLANPIVWVVAAIAALVAALILAYNYCKPFKDAVDALGKAIGEGLGKAVEWIKSGLEWLWNNILVPLGNFIIDTFMSAINWLGEKLAWLAGPVKAVGDAFGWLAGVIGGAINAVGAKIEEYNDLMKAAEESTKNGLSVMENFYRNKYDSMTAKVDEALSKQLETIIAKNQDAVDAENKAYEEDLAAFNAYWDKKLSVTESELQKIDQKINEFYDKQIKAVEDSTQKQIDALQSAYDKELSDFVAFWDTKFGVSNTELDKVQGAISAHYDQEISDTQASYQTLIDEANAFYDGLQAVTDAGLVQLRASREADFDNMELLMLEEKVSLEQAHAAGLISDEDYQKQKTALSKAYNDERSVLTDSYRLKELQMEKENKEASTAIASEREAALTVIKTNEETAIAGIEAKKNADLQVAQQQYSQITQTDFQALTAAILSLKNNESTQVTAIEKQKNHDLKTAADQYTAMQTAHYNELVSLANQKANDIANAEKAAAETKKQMLAQIESQINGNMNISAEEKKHIIADMNASCLADTQSQWTNIADTIQAAMDKINNQNAVFQQALNSGKITAEEYATAIEFQNQQANNLAAQASWNAQNAAFAQALSSHQITQAQYNQAMTFQNANKPPGLAEGGIVTEPTLALIGEAGPEAVIPLKNGNISTAIQGSSRSSNVTVYPYIYIGVVNKEMDLEKFKKILVEEVNSAMGEIANAEAY